jgi:hypothetical protein
MSEKIVVGPINKGLRNDRTAFVIDNDSFPTLINAYQWRGRVKRKRGTSFLGRLTRFFNSTSTAYSTFPSFNLLAGAGNLLVNFSLQIIGNIIPGSVSIVDTTTSNTFTDLNMDGTLQGTPAGSGTINYATGAITIAGATTDTITASFRYTPDLPVMGLEDLTLIPTQFPQTLAFDTKYSYNLLTASPYPNYDVSFYKNPAADGTLLPGYVPKTIPTPTSWNSQDYQQFWTANYQGALWATNGITVPFNITNIGMQFKVIGAITTTATTATMVIVAHGLVVGDFVFINEVPPGITGINFQTGYVTTVVDANDVIVTFPFAALAGTASGGIAQYLTNRSDITKDCLRFYDGDPTNGNVLNPGFTQGMGWVNFAPPLSEFFYSIADLPAAQYYLVGCRMIVPFKDRLLFLGPVVQTSGGGIFYLQDTIIYSQNGTPYYTVSYKNFVAAVDDPINIEIAFHSLLVPINQTATAPAYFEDQTGFGGYISAGISQPIITVSSNEDVLIVGFDRFQTRVIYSGNDLVPFNFYIINNELGSSSTFSSINMDQGVLTRGSRGFIATSQTSAQRIDLEIPDQVFQINLTQNGNERFCATRDFINEWVYFTYPDNNDAFKFPNQTLLYNYRDNSWAIFEESYTTYGAFRRQTGFTWQTVGLVYPSWNVWNDPWNAGESTLLQQEVIAGNQQGFIVARDIGTGESPSIYIQSFSGSTNIVTSPDHNLNDGDYIIISGVIGTAGALVNSEIFSIFNVMQNTFQLDPDPLLGTATYFGGGLITKMYVPFIQTKQFPASWDMARKTRLGPQQYLLTTTNNAQITLLIFLSQNSASAYNLGNIVPTPNSVNNSLIYSTILYTCPESTNLGLTPASANMANPFNTNLQMVTALQQAQIWHRKNTSLIGDTIQIGFTLSEEQMRDLEVSGVGFAITAANRANPLVIDSTGDFEIGQIIEITGIVGMTELNNNFYHVINSTLTTITLNVDSTNFTPYISGGFATPVAGVNGFSEIELHSFILDVSPSSLLA